MLISIIIPTLNRAESLKQTIASIRDQQNAPDFELIVIDNGSTDDTRLVEAFLEENFAKAQYHFNPIPGLLSSRHLGARQATGEVLVFFDDDVTINPLYLQGVHQLFSNNTVQLATGPCLPSYEGPVPAWLNYFWTATAQGKYCGFLSLIDLGDKQAEIDPNLVWGLNFCIRKSALFELEGFNPDTMPPSLQRFQGDGETGLTIKAKLRGIKAHYDARLKLHHHVPASRLTKEYFVKRSFFQGVCNSFTQLRAQHLGVEESNNNTPATPGKIRKLRNAIHPLYRWIKPLFKHTEPQEIQALKLDILNAENEGFHFHQQCFATDETVKTWVLKNNYLDSQQLPDE